MWQCLIHINIIIIIYEELNEYLLARIKENFQDTKLWLLGCKKWMGIAPGKNKEIESHYWMIWIELKK